MQQSFMFEAFVLTCAKESKAIRHMAIMRIETNTLGNIFLFFILFFLNWNSRRTQSWHFTVAPLNDLFTLLCRKGGDDI